MKPARRAAGSRLASRLAAVGGSLVAAAACATACVPASFDGLSGYVDPPPDGSSSPRSSDGGARPIDETLEAPRPVSPLSVTWVNTARPVFRWAATSRLTSATIELSRSRSDFDAQVVHRFVATSRELTAPVDLEPGMWFWRVRGRSEAADGLPAKAPHLADVSLTWQFLVRGPSAAGSSSIPTGAILDRNGDGLPDLSVPSLEKFETDQGERTGPLLVVAHGEPNGVFSFYSDRSSYVSLPGADTTGITLGGAIDFDGDGFADISFAGLDSEIPSGAYPGDPLAIPFAQIAFGSPSGVESERDFVQGGIRFPFDGFVRPNVEVAGDTNGDGFGDVGLALPLYTMAVLGSAEGESGVLRPYTKETLPTLPSGTPITPMAVADFDGDGFADFAVCANPVAVAHGGKTRVTSTRQLANGDLDRLKRATGLVAGDFDGDGASEIAFVAPREDDSTLLCFVKGSLPVRLRDCWESDGTIQSRPIMVDIDLDGRDDVVVATTTGLYEVHWSIGAAEGTPAVTAKQIRPASDNLGKALASVYPGRPGPAVWAVLDDAGDKVSIFRGAAAFQALTREPQFSVKFGPEIR